MLNNQYINKSFIFIFLCLCFHILASIFSFGFYSDDEHFQILEPIAYLMGINTQLVNDPTWYYWEWEGSIRLRPLIQIYFYYFILKPFEYLQNPFIWSFIIRIISSIIGFLSIIYLFFTFKKKYKFKETFFNYFIFFCFWFYPFLHSRTSSENLGLSVFIFGLCLIYNVQARKIDFIKILVGIFLIGISIDIRFNLIFSAVPIICFIMLKKYDELKLFSIYVIFISALAIGILIDSIFWGFYTNTFYQFYKFNMGEFNILNDFGIEPWWYYITETIKTLSPLLSVVFLISIIYFWIKKPLDYLTLITLFHFIILSLIGHKEIRYIFPIFIFAPVFIIYLLDNINLTYILKPTKIILIASNIIFLTIVLFYPMNNKVNIYKYIYNNINKTDEIFYYGENPYQVNNMEPFFYTNFLNDIKSYDENDQTKDYYIITKDFEYVKNNLNNCEERYSTIPKFLFNINPNWKRLKLNWEILFCKIES